MAFQTQAVHKGSNLDPNTGSVIPGIHLASTFVPNNPGGFLYSRFSNPNRDGLETCLAELEGGEAAFCFGSGSAAGAMMVQALGHGGEVVAIDDMYGGSYKQLSVMFPQMMNIKTKFASFSTMKTPQEVLDVISPETKLVWLESPTNPTLLLPNLKMIIDAVKSLPNAPLVMVDNTFLSPYFSNPILWAGADVIMQSLTKLIGGHSDLIGGALIVRKGLPELCNKFRFLQGTVGAVPSPFDVFLAQRGLKTLAVRAMQCGRSALEIAQKMQTLPMISKVTYCGLASHPDYEIAKASLSQQVKKDLKRMRWDEKLEGGIPYGAVLSFWVKGDEETADRFLNSLKIVAHAVSLGGVESLACRPMQITHAAMPVELRQRLGITENMVRFSVGVEDVDDLFADIQQALLAAEKHTNGNGEAISKRQKTA